MHTLAAIIHPSARDKIVCRHGLQTGLLTWILGNRVIAIGTVSPNLTIDSQSSEHAMFNLLMICARIFVRIHALKTVHLRAVLADQTPSPSAVSLLMNFHWISVSRDLSRATKPFWSLHVGFAWIFSTVQARDIYPAALRAVKLGVDLAAPV
jgi:hypothetical protein